MKPEDYLPPTRGQLGAGLGVSFQAGLFSRCLVLRTFTSGVLRVVALLG